MSSAPSERNLLLGILAVQMDFIHRDALIRASRCGVYLWSLEQRARDESGKAGILHVKCAVADSRWLFLSSANLTEYAFTLNLELGLLVKDRDLPSKSRGISTG